LITSYHFFVLTASSGITILLCNEGDRMYADRLGPPLLSSVAILLYKSSSLVGVTTIFTWLLGRSSGLYNFILNGLFKLELLRSYATMKRNNNNIVVVLQKEIIKLYFKIDKT